MRPILSLSSVACILNKDLQKLNDKILSKNIGLCICREHGGEPKSVEFSHKVALNYESCSPYRIPIARLAAALAAIKNDKCCSK